MTIQEMYDWAVRHDVTDWDVMQVAAWEDVNVMGKYSNQLYYFEEGKTRVVLKPKEE